MRIADGTRGGNGIMIACGATVALIGLLALAGWVFEAAVLVRFADVLQPMRPASALAFLLAGWAVIASSRNDYKQVRAVTWALIVLCVSGAAVSVLQWPMPFSDWFQARAARMGFTWTEGIQPLTALGLVAFAAALIISARPALSTTDSLFVYALGIILIAYVGLIAIVQVSDGKFSAPDQLHRGISFQPLIGLTLLGTALIASISRTREAPLMPPLWVPGFVGLVMGALVIVLWMVLRDEDRFERQHQASLAAESMGRGIEMRLESVERVLYRIASTSPDVDNAPMELARGLDGVKQGLPWLERAWWIDASSRVVARWPDSTAAADSIELHVMQRVRELSAGPADISGLRLFVEALPDDTMTMAVVAPVLRRNGTEFLVGAISEPMFLESISSGAGEGFEIDFAAPNGDSAAHDAGALRFPFAQRFDRKTIRFDVVIAPDARQGGILPEVVLVLGLGISALLATVLQLLRTSWRQARMVESARLQSAFDTATDGVWEYDFTSDRGRRNPTQISYLGYDPDEINRKPGGWVELLHDEDRERVMSAVRDNASSRDFEHGELMYRVRAADGSYHTILDRGRVVERLPNGKPKVMLGISADITERMRADEELAASEQRFRTMFDSAQQFQVLVDREGRNLEVNAAAISLAGRNRDELVGQPLVSGPWWTEDDVSRPRLIAELALALEGEPTRFELTAQSQDGRRVFLDVSCTPLLDGEQQVNQVLIEARDITERRRAEEALREIGAFTTIGRLAARVAHEINNPLAGIQNSFLLLADAIPPDHPHHRFVGAIEREIQRIAVVTRQLYETYRPDQESSHASVALAVTDAVNFLDQVNRNRGVTIVADLSRAPSAVPVPDALLRQTLYNLVQNAVEASPRESRVTVTVDRDNDHCRIVVRDEGEGIAPHLRDRIWDPFFSGKDAKVKRSGIGLGLSLVRQSVEAVGGTARLLDSDVGAAFEVRIPMTPVTRSSR